MSVEWEWVTHYEIYEISEDGHLKRPHNLGDRIFYSYTSRESAIADIETNAYHREVVILPVTVSRIK